VSYASESRELDAEILRAIGAWRDRDRTLNDDEFDDIALRLFAYQIAYDKPYARYCASLGFAPSSLPASWHEIPAVPAAAFKEATLTTFDPNHAALAFETSGTTTGLGGRHYLESRELYDASLLAGFDRFMLPERARLRYLNLVPNPADRPESSLGYMMAQVSAQRGDAQTGWYLRGEDLFFDAFIADLRAAVDDAQAVCIATTAFALLHVIELMERRQLVIALPKSSRVMETGGFKGRARAIEREELYPRASERFGIATDAIVAEYGMTELCSQYYDDALVHPRPALSARRKLAPPWLRSRVVGADGKTLPSGTVGALVHVDLANRSSCMAISTEDLGVQFDDGLVVIGRDRGATLRGCSLDAESLQPR
jgi:hypothetical protein